MQNIVINNFEKSKKLSIKKNVKVMKSSKSTTPSMNHSSETSHIENYDEETTNTSSSTVDFSLLRKPIITSVTGFSEAKKAYDSGTEEVIS